MADEDRMITFNYARTTWDAYKKQTIPTSNECMTKADIDAYLNADMTVLSSYANKQLIPRSKFVGNLPIVIDDICGRTYMKKIRNDNNETKNISIKGSGKFLFYFNSTYGTSCNVYLKDILLNVNVFYTFVSSDSIAVLIDKPTTDERFYTIGTSNVSGTLSNYSVYSVTCALQESNKIAFPERIFLYQEAGGIICRDFIYVIRGMSVSDVHASYSFNTPSNGPAFLNSRSPSSYKGTNDADNISCIQEKFNSFSGSLPSLGTVVSGYSVTINFNGISRTVNFDIEVVAGADY